MNFTREEYIFPHFSLGFNCPPKVNLVCRYMYTAAYVVILRRYQDWVSMPLNVNIIAIDFFPDDSLPYVIEYS